MFCYLLACERPRSVRARVNSAVVMTLMSASVHAQVAHDHAAMTKAPPVVATPGAPPTNTPSMSNPVATLNFESVFARYKPMTDQKLGSWREANDTVTRIGGWRAYLKESQAPEVTAPASPAAPSKPAAPTAANPHADHGAKQ